MNIDYGAGLAAMGRDCPIYHSDNIVPKCAHSSPHCPSCICHGTGKIPMFPGVRASCQQMHYLISTTLFSTSTRMAVCHEVGCPGYTVSDRLEDWLDAAKPAMLANSWVLFPDINGWEIWKDTDEIAPEDFVSSGTTVIAAVQEALWKAVKP